MTRKEERPHFKLPNLPGPLKNLPDWLQIGSVVVTLVVAFAVFICSRFSPDFLVEYKDMDQVPLSAITRGYGVLSNPIRNDGRTRLLRVSVRNNRSSAGGQDIKLIVADYIQTLAFVMEENGDPIHTYTLTPAGNTSRLEVSVGYLPPRSERVIFIGGKCLFLDFADIHAESSNLGISDSARVGELAGVRLFVGANAEWIAMLLLVACSFILLCSFKKKRQ